MMMCSSTGVILLLASTEDLASKAQQQALLDRGGWDPIAPPEEGTEAWANGRVHLWLVREGFLQLDDIDERWAAGGAPPASELIFLSRHAAASGKPCLTVHPIGVPSLHASADTLERGGGRAGTLPPPSRRLAALYRELYAMKKADALPTGFDVSLEATHHGPVVRTPACFLEIGSTEDEWENRDAAAALAEALCTELRPHLQDEVEAQLEAEAKAEAEVWVVLGGGHYMPKAGDLARKEGARLGHCLASYAIGFAEDESGDPLRGLVDGGGAHAIKEAVRASQLAWGDGATVRVQVDKKAFAAPRRAAICALLESQGIPHRLK